MAETEKQLEGARARSAPIKDRVLLRSAQRKEERAKARELELKEHEAFLQKAREVLTPSST